MKIVDLTPSIKHRLFEEFNRKDEFTIFKDFVSDAYKCELGFISDEYWPRFLLFENEKDYTWFVLNITT